MASLGAVAPPTKKTAKFSVKFGIEVPVGEKDHYGECMTYGTAPSMLRQRLHDSGLKFMSVKSNRHYGGHPKKGYVQWNLTISLLAPFSPDHNNPYRWRAAVVLPQGPPLTLTGQQLLEKVEDILMDIITDVDGEYWEGHSLRIATPHFRCNFLTTPWSELDE